MESALTGSLKVDAARRESFGSQNSQTAKEYVGGPKVPPSNAKLTVFHVRFIDSQIRLEADAREILPYVSAMTMKCGVCAEINDTQYIVL